MDQQSQSIEQVPKCTSCLQYLSVPPIHISTDGYWCGRCELTLLAKLDSFESTYHLKAYEALAYTMQFPCQYDISGCKKKLNFNKVQNHENYCKFRTENCPVKDCQVKINAGQLLDHYQQYHKELIVDSREFSLQVAEDSSKHYLTVLNSKPYILSVLTSTEEEKIYLGVYNFIDIPAKGNFLIEVKAKGTNSIIVNEESIRKFDPEESFSEAKMLNFDYKYLQSLLKGVDLVFSIKLPNVVLKNPLNSELLEELECIVCQEYMKAPIYICATGHSICAKCKNRVAQCPLCKAVFGGARNFALEKLSEKTEMACKAKKASSIGESSKIEPPTWKCPLKVTQKCKWVGLAKDVLVHSKEKHPQLTFPGSIRMYRDLGVTLAENFVMCFDNNTFKVFLKNHAKGPFWCTILHNELPMEVEPQYQFVINFGAYIVANFCCSALKYPQKEPHVMSFIPVKMSYSDLTPLKNKNNNCLTFTIEIEKYKAV